MFITPAHRAISAAKAGRTRSMASSRLRIVVSGMVAKVPNHGGATWAVDASDLAAKVDAAGGGALFR